MSIPRLRDRFLYLAVVLAALVALPACKSGGSDDVITRGETSIQVTIEGTGLGNVSHNLGTAICSQGTCTWDFTAGLTVTLTASPAAGSKFSGWSGACTGTAANCTLVVDRQWDVTATFNLQ